MLKKFSAGVHSRQMSSRVKAGLASAGNARQVYCDEQFHDAE
jgi:hypothetical protein